MRRASAIFPIFLETSARAAEPATQLACEMPRKFIGMHFSKWRSSIPNHFWVSPRILLPLIESVRRRRIPRPPRLTSSFLPLARTSNFARVLEAVERARAENTAANLPVARQNQIPLLFYCIYCMHSDNNSSNRNNT